MAIECSKGRHVPNDIITGWTRKRKSLGQFNWCEKFSGFALNSLSTLAGIFILAVNFQWFQWNKFGNDSHFKEIEVR